MCVVVSSSLMGGKGEFVSFSPFAAIMCLLALPVLGERLPNDAILIGSTVLEMFTRCCFYELMSSFFCQCEIVFPKNCTV